MLLFKELFEDFVVGVVGFFFLLCWLFSNIVNLFVCWEIKRKSVLNYVVGFFVG